MSEDRTSSITKIVSGDALYQKRARFALPILVRQALAGKEIYYADLAKELEMPNPRNLNCVLGCVGDVLLELGELWQEKIPSIQGLVVNQQTGLPGNSVHFLRQIAEPRQKEEIVKAELSKVFSYPKSKWLNILEEFGLSPAEPLNPQFEQPMDHRSSTRESEAHKRLKNYIAHHPGAVGLKKSLAPGETEYQLPSGDIPDVLFQSERCRIAIEVKSHISPETDIRRGIFQCVKYRAILRACRSLKGETYEVNALLAIEGQLPKKLIPVKNTLGVKVIENIRVK